MNKEMQDRARIRIFKFNLKMKYFQGGNGRGTDWVSQRLTFPDTLRDCLTNALLVKPLEKMAKDIKFWRVCWPFWAISCHFWPFLRPQNWFLLPLVKDQTFYVFLAPFSNVSQTHTCHTFVLQLIKYIKYIIYIKAPKHVKERFSFNWWTNKNI